MILTVECYTLEYSILSTVLNKSNMERVFVVRENEVRTTLKLITFMKLLSDFSSSLSSFLPSFAALPESEGTHQRLRSLLPV